MTPCFWQDAIALWLPSLRDLACVDRSWNASVLYVIKSLQNSTFCVDWLVLETGRDLLLHPEVRLNRLLSGVDKSDPDVVWWYGVQLHLHAFCQKYSQRYLRAPSCRAIFLICYRQSLCNGRRGRELFHDFLEVPGVIDRPVNVALFHDRGLVRTRDMGCRNLGRGVKEVFGTLLCMIEGTPYCERWGCSCLDSSDSQCEMP